MATPVLAERQATWRPGPLVAALGATGAILVAGGAWEGLAALTAGMAAPFGPAFVRLPTAAVAFLGAAMVGGGLLALRAAVRAARGDFSAVPSAAWAALILTALTFPSGLLFGVPAAAALLLARRA